MEGLADPSKWGDLDENDPKSMAKWMKRMGRELGEDVGDVDEMMDEAMQEETKTKPDGRGRRIRHLLGRAQKS